MNKVYRLVRNRHSGLVQVASEITRAHGKSKTLTVGAGATAPRGVTCTVVMLALLGASPATAEDITWVGTPGGNWSVASNWDPARLPTSTDNAFVDGWVFGTAGAEANSLYLGYSNNSQLIIQGSNTLSTTNAYLGYNTGVEGLVAVFGASASWSNSGSLTVGHDGTSTLRVEDGGTLNVAGGTGTLVLASGSGSGTLNIGTNNAAGVLNAATVTGGSGTATLNFNHTDGAYYFTTDGTSSGAAIAITGSTAVNHIGSGKTTLTGNNTYTGGTTVSAGTLQGNTTSLQGAITNNAAVSFNQVADGTYAGVMSGTGALTKSGIGTLTLTGANTYTGTTHINAGTLQLGDGNTANTSIASDIVTAQDSQLIFNLNGSYIYSRDISGAGSVRVTPGSGYNHLTLAGSNTHTGGTTIDAGMTVQIGNVGTSGAITGDVVNNGRLNFHRSDAVTFGGAISGSGNVTVSGGNLTLTGNNTHTGNTNNFGTLQIGNGGTSGAISGNIANFGGSLVFNRADDVAYGGIISGSGSLTKIGAGTLTLTGANSYTGGTTVSAGTLQGNTTSLQGAITNNAAVSFNQVADGTYAGDMSGTGALTKIGGGILTLTGANTYSGDTTVKAGTLAVSGTGRIGGVTLANLRVGRTSGDNGTLVIEAGGQVGSDWAFIGGSFPDSTGVATVTGTGSTWTTSNTLYAGFGGRGTLTISNGGKVSNDEGEIGFFTDSIGSVTVTGSGSEWENTGELIVANFGNATLTIADGGRVSSNIGYISRANLVTGTVTVTGTGSTWANTGNIYLGNGGLTTTSTLNIGNYDLSAPDTAGTVTALRLTASSGSGTVNFNQTDATTFATPIEGNIAVNQRGTGTTTLSGTHTYTGATTISGGTLAVNGSLTNSAVTVASGGTLGGSGSIAGAVTVNSGGTLAPGNSPGLLSVGSLTLDAGSTTTMEIDGTARGTQYDAIDVTGTATLGGTLNLVFGYTPTVGDSYALIDAAAINGDFSTIDTSGLGAALKVVPTITNDYVMTVDLAQESFVTAAGGTGALTSNQSSVATNLDTFSTSGQATDLIAALNTLPAGALPSAYDQISGASHTFAPTLAGNAVRQFSHVLGQRSGGIQAGDGASTAFNALTGVKLAYAGDDLASLVAGEKVARDGFWVRALAADGRINSDGNAAGADTSGTGLALGADRWIDANRLAGVALAYGTSRADSGGGKLDVESFQLAAYGRWQDEAYYLDGSLGYGRHRTESRRDIAFLNQQARADYDTDSLSLNLEAGRPIVRGPATLTPYVGVEGTMLRREGFTETGSAANLSVAGDTQTGWRSRLGARYQWSGTRFQPTLDLAWVHAFGDAATQVDALFAAAPTASAFRVAGPELDRDRLALGLGLTAWTGKHARLDLNYNGEFASSDRDQHVAATFRWVW